MNPIRESLKLSGCGGYKVYLEGGLPRERGEGRAGLKKREKTLSPMLSWGQTGVGTWPE